MNHEFPGMDVPFDENTELLPRRAIGFEPVVINFPHGSVPCVEAQSLTAMNVSFTDLDTGEPIFMVCAAMVIPLPGAQQIGGITAMAPKDARSLAANLISAAEEVEQAARGLN